MSFLRFPRVSSVTAVFLISQENVACKGAFEMISTCDDSAPIDKILGQALNDLWSDPAMQRVRQRSWQSDKKVNVSATLRHSFFCFLSSGCVVTNSARLPRAENISKSLLAVAFRFPSLPRFFFRINPRPPPSSSTANTRSVSKSSFFGVSLHGGGISFWRHLYVCSMLHALRGHR